MRKVLVLAAAALVAPSMALADGEMASHPYFGGVFFGRTSMDMPAHASSPQQYDFGSGLKALELEGANADGFSYGIGVGKNLDSGWRVAAIFRYFDGEGAAAKNFTFASLPTSSRGPLSGGTPPGFLDTLVSPYGCGAGIGCSAAEKLDTSVQEWGGSLSAGRSLFGPVHGDLVFNYAATDSDYDHSLVITTPVNFPLFSDVSLTRTNFSESQAELAARLSVDFALMDGVSIGVGGSAGYAYSHVNMTTSQRLVNTSTLGVTTLTGASVLDKNDGDYGFIGRGDANLTIGLTDRLSIAAVGSYVSDSLVPVYSSVDAPNYVAHTPATFHFETQSSTTYGVRVVTRW